MKEIKLVSDTIDKADIERLTKWLSSDQIPRLTKGPVTIEFEEKWSSYLGVKHTTYVNSGSSAILLALAALKQAGLKNEKVVVPTLSWLTDISSVMQLGMQPILCDCNLTDLSVDLEHLENIFIKEEPSVLILVSVLGLVPQMDKVLELCKKHNVLLIEDVCESMGSEYNGKKLGTFGDISLFSLYYGHHLSTIEGGLVCTNNESLYYVINSMRSHGWDRDWPKEVQEKYRKEYQVSDFDALYTFYYPGFNLRATDLQAYIGLTQIDKLNNFAKIRNNNFQTYNRLLTKSLLNIRNDQQNFISNFAYPYLSNNRNKIANALMENNVEVRPLIAGSLARKPFWYKTYGIVALPNADLINEKGFYIPNHQDLTEEDISRICDIIHENEE
jgi:CDP-6-deoxy-D-xylo-4-hexulose-3-dehydrase